MNNTIDKQKLVEYLNGKISESLYGKEAFAYQSVLMAITQSDLFDIPNNHLREALAEVKVYIHRDEIKTAIEVIDNSLNTSVTERGGLPPMEDVLMDEPMPVTIEPSVDRVREHDWYSTPDDADLRCRDCGVKYKNRIGMACEGGNEG